MHIGIVIAAIALLVWASQCFRIINEYERGVVFRLGVLQQEPLGRGLQFILWPIDRLIKVSMRTVVLDVPPQDVITKDNVSVKVNAVIYFRVMEANAAIVEVENYLYATGQYAQTTLRSVLGQAELDDLLSERDRLNQSIQEILDHHTDPWGVKVSAVEIKHVDLPTEMQRAMARQAEAERERRAKVIHAEGEFQASVKLTEAAKIISKDPAALQLRYLQTVSEMSSERGTMLIFPLPINLLEALVPRRNQADDA